MYPKDAIAAALGVKQAEAALLVAARAYAESATDDEQGVSHRTYQLQMEMVNAARALATADQWVEDHASGRAKLRLTP